MGNLVSRAQAARSARVLARCTGFALLVGAFVITSNPAGAAIPTSGLAAYWAFDENSGTTAGDSSGNNQHGTLTAVGGNLPVWDSANKAPMYGNVSSLYFADGGFVNVPEQPAGDNPLDANTAGPNNDNLTLASWIYIDSTKLTTGNNSIIRKGDTANREYGMDLTVTSPTDIKLRSFVNSSTSGGGTADLDPGTSNVPTDVWVHVAMTYDGSQVTGYIDAAADGPGSAGTGDIFDNNSSVRIGGQPAAAGGGAIPFRGNLDEVRVYNRVLAPSELAILAGDTDGDGVEDAADNCPVDENSNQANNDGDTEGDVCDEDDDNDGAPDTSDNCPMLANSDQANNDGDSAGDVCDPDDDNDGVQDGDDAFPFDPDESNDNDNDGTGDNADTDDDNDGQSDADETQCGSDPLNGSSKSPDQDGDGSPDCVDPDDNGDGIPDTAPPTNKDQCKKNGWKSFNNPAFKNQGDCVSYVSTGGKNPPAG